MTTSTQIISAFLQFCEQEELHMYQVSKFGFVTYIGGQNGRWQVLCDIQATRIHIYSILPVTVPDKQWLNIQEFLRWVNCQLAVGNFELHAQSREIRFKTSLDVADGALTHGMLRVLIYENIQATDHCLKSLQQILFAGKTLAEAAGILSESAETEEGNTEVLREMLDDPDLAKLLSDDDDSREKGNGD